MQPSIKKEKYNLIKLYPTTWKDFSEWLFFKYRTENCFDYGKIEFQPIIEQFIEFPFAAQVGIFLEFLDNRGIQISIHPEYYTTGINWCWQLLWYAPNREWKDFDGINKKRNNKPYRPDIHSGTFSYGDNAEHQTPQSAYMAAIKLAFEKLEQKILIGKPQKK